MGKAILFWNQTPNGDVVDLSKHASITIHESGRGENSIDEKWALTAWIQEDSQYNDEIEAHGRKQYSTGRNKDSAHIGLIKYFHRLCRSPVSSIWERK